MAVRAYERRRVGKGRIERGGDGRAGVCEGDLTGGGELNVPWSVETEVVAARDV